MVAIFIALVWVGILSAAVCAIVLLIEAINDQRSPRRKKPITKIPQPKQGKALRQLAARSRLDHPDYSESWHWKSAQQQLKTRQKELQEQKVSAHTQQPLTSKVQKQLFTLVNGDMKTANRLLEHTRKTNPLESEQWVWEKVVFDLERDRC